MAISGNSSVSKFNTTGAMQSPLTGFNAGGINIPYALAIDQSGAVWVANSGNNTVTNLTPPYTGGAVSAPASLAISPR